MTPNFMPPPPLALMWQKRCFDVILSAMILVIVTPVLAIFVVLIFFEHLLLKHPLDPIFYFD